MSAPVGCVHISTHRGQERRVFSSDPWKGSVKATVPVFEARSFGEAELFEGGRSNAGDSCKGSFRR